MKNASVQLSITLSAILLLSVTLLLPVAALAAPAEPGIRPEVLRQIDELIREKQSRSEAESRLATMLRKKTREPAVLKRGGDVIVEVELTAAISQGLLNRIRNLGGEIVNSFPGADRARVTMPLSALDRLARHPNVRVIRPAAADGVSTTTPGFSPFFGTSAAAPHAAAIAGLMLDADPGMTPSQIRQAMFDTALDIEASGTDRDSGHGLLDGEAAVLEACGSDCGGDTEHYTGYLTGTGDTETEPDGTYYFSAAGVHTGTLEGPTSNADFDLFLYRWNGSAWSVVGSSESGDSSEAISYNGSAGYYIWQVKSWSGSGNYDFWLDRP